MSRKREDKRRDFRRENREAQARIETELLALHERLKDYDSLAVEAFNLDNPVEYFVLLDMINAYGVIDESVIDSVQRLGKAILDTYRSSVRMARVKSIEEQERHNDAFNKSMAAEIEALKAKMPLLALCFKEAALVAFSEQVEGVLAKGKSPAREMRALKGQSNYTTYHSVADAIGIRESCRDMKGYMSNEASQARTNESFELFRDVVFEYEEASEGKAKFFGFRAPDRVRGGTAFEVRVTVSKNMQPYELVHFVFVKDGRQVVGSVSRINGELCPVGASIVNFKSILGEQAYNVIRDAVFNCIEIALERDAIKEEVVPDVESDTDVLLEELAAAQLEQAESAGLSEQVETEIELEQPGKEQAEVVTAQPEPSVTQAEPAGEPVNWQEIEVPLPSIYLAEFCRTLKKCGVGKPQPTSGGHVKFTRDGKTTVFYRLDETHRRLHSPEQVSRIADLGISFAEYISKLPKKRLNEIRARQKRVVGIS